MHTAASTATILRFRAPPPPPPHRFSPRERLVLAMWEPQVLEYGLARAVLHAPVADCDPSYGEFVLIYRDGTPWAEYGVGREGHGYIAWRPATGATLGRFEDLEAALAAVFDDWSAERLRRMA